MREKIYDRTNGLLYYGPLLLFGLVLIFCGFALCTVSVFAGLVPIVIGLMFFTTVDGFQIDLDNNRCRHYTGYYYFLKKGKWRRLDQFTDVSVVSGRMLNRAQGKATGVTYHTVHHDVFLLGPRHLRRLRVASFSYHGEAISLADSISRNFPFKLSDYQPQLSKKSLRRRNAHNR